MRTALTSSSSLSPLFLCVCCVLCNSSRLEWKCSSSSRMPLRRKTRKWRTPWQGLCLLNTFRWVTHTGTHTHTHTHIHTHTHTQAQGVSAADIKKLKDGGINSIEGLAHAPKKELLLIKGLSDAKVEKLQAAGKSSSRVLCARGAAKPAHPLLPPTFCLQPTSQSQWALCPPPLSTSCGDRSSRFQRAARIWTPFWMVRAACKPSV